MKSLIHFSHIAFWLKFDSENLQNGDYLHKFVHLISVKILLIVSNKTKIF